MSKNNSCVVFGASGRTGKEVVNEAVSKGISVRAVVRKTSAIFFQEPIQTVFFDYTNIEVLTKIISGVSCVVIAFGPRSPYKDLFCAEATKNIVMAMEKLGVKRIICQTGAMTGDYQNNRSFFFGLMSTLFRINDPRAYNDRVEQEDVIKQSSLEWTIVKPPRLTDIMTHNVVAGPDVRVGLLSSISRKSLAGFIVNEIESPQYIDKVVFVRN